MAGMFGIRVIKETLLLSGYRVQKVLYYTTQIYYTNYKGVVEKWLAKRNVTRKSK